jgi:CHAT domain-containing protein
MLHGTTIAALSAALSENEPRWFLFCGHGDVQLQGECTLGFTNGQGVFEVADADDIAKLFGTESRAAPPELVHLSGCCTLELGKALIREGVKYVVCWKTKVCDKAAAIFSNAFYRELRAGNAYPGAFSVASLVLKGAPTPGALGTGHAAYVPKYALVDPDDSKQVGKWFAYFFCLSDK